LFRAVDDAARRRDRRVEFLDLDLLAREGRVLELGASASQHRELGKGGPELSASDLFDDQVAALGVPRSPWWASTPTSACRAAS